MSILIRSVSDDYIEYLRDESRTEGNAEGIAFPVSETEVMAIISQARNAGQRITLQGARTGIAAGAVPNGGIVLSLTKMDKALGMRRAGNGQFYLNVQPGMILSRLRGYIASKRFDTTGWDDISLAAFADFKEAPEQYFTCDPTEASCTIGGMVACASSGANSYLYGSVRPYVTGLRVILADNRTLTMKRGEVFAKGRKLSLILDSGDVMELTLPAYKMPDVKKASGYYNY